MTARFVILAAAVTIAVGAPPGAGRLTAEHAEIAEKSWGFLSAISAVSAVNGVLPHALFRFAGAAAVPQTFTFAGAPAQSAAASPSDLTLRIGVARGDGSYTVTTIPLETYVARVLAGEAARDSPPAALEALAIAVRTFTLANRGRHRADGFDLCDETHCQVMRPPTPVTEQAATATAGLALLRGGAPASIYYSASCGGRTEIPSAVWPGADDPPYLPSRPDDACGGAPAWSAELSAADLLRALRAGGFRGDRLRNLRIASRNGSGRVGRLRVDGLKPDLISGQDLRVVVGRTLGWQFIKSTAFDLRRDGNTYRFNGHGSGHGVGLCVIGSMHLAAGGQSREAILHRYFPGLVIATPPGIPRSLTTEATRSTRPDPPDRAAAAIPRTASPPRATPSPASPPAPPPIVPEVLVSLPDGDEGERGFITDLAARARDDLARRLGVTAPRVTLRFHPTVDSYERATREPWFTSGAIVDGDIHLLPPAVLRERGVLDRTIRHELVHVMTNAPLAERPLWVREGAAIYFAGEPAIPGGKDLRTAPPPRTSCPDDAELLRPVSAGALTNAYARAQACFARQMGQRRSWRDVR
jgi:SpoIID/LytB domain protein